MAIMKKLRINVLLAALLLIVIMFIASASTNNSQKALPKGEIFEFNDSNSQRILLADFGPNDFAELKKP